jgi:hypothetical protein
MRRLVVGLAAVIVVGVLAGVAGAANPHFVPASASFAGPTVNGPGDIQWDATMSVPFRLAGLGKNAGVTVSLTAKSVIAITEYGGGGTFVSDQGGTADDFGYDGIGIVDPVVLSINQHVETDTLTSDKNGNVSGTLTLPATLSTVVTGGGSECVIVSWTNITLTAGGVTASVPDLSRQYDSTGTACAG